MDSVGGRGPRETPLSCSLRQPPAKGVQIRGFRGSAGSRLLSSLKTVQLSDVISMSHQKFLQTSDTGMMPPPVSCTVVGSLPRLGGSFGLLDQLVGEDEGV